MSKPDTSVASADDLLPSEAEPVPFADDPDDEDARDTRTFYRAGLLRKSA